MRSRRSPPVPPANTRELLTVLRQFQLLDEEPLRRLHAVWRDEDEPQPHVEELIRAGLLTRHQGKQILAGRARSLRLGPYRILDRLGRGGMGQVYKAEHLLLRRLVALKVARRDPTEKIPPSPVTPRRCSGRPTQMAREVEMVGQLSHPNVVAAHDARRFGNRLVLVLEYVDGIDLARLVNETGPLPVRLAVEVTRQAALALAHLHEQKLVHRDVKPANLMLNHAATLEGVPSVKLLDLGLACPISQAGDELCGTPDFLAPERGLSPQATDVRGDLYSLGCTLYFLLSGRVPFPGGGWTGKLLRHRIEHPEPLPSLRPDVSPAVVALVERLMAREPEQRFAEPNEVIKAIEAITWEQVLVPASAPQSPPERSTHSRRLTLATLCLAAIVLGAGAGKVAQHSFTASIASPSPRQREVARPSRALVPTTSNSERLGQELVGKIESATDGAIVEIPVGRHVIPPIRIHGKRLTLRGSSSGRTVLIRSTHTTWDALIESEHDLTLERLDVQGGDGIGPPAPLVGVYSADLTVRDCNLTQNCDAPAIMVRKGTRLRLDGTRITAEEQAVALQVASRDDGQVHLQGCEVILKDVARPAVLFWATESDPSRRLEVEIAASKIRAGRIVACRSLTAPVQLRARDNQFIFHQSFVSLDGGPPDNWRDRLHWQGQRNRYESSGPWLQIDGRAVPSRNEEAFAKLWSDQH